MRSWIIVMLLILLFVWLVPSLYAQDSTGASICVLAYEDANENSTLDTGEAPLPGIAVHLMIDTDLIINSYVTTQENRPYCFEGLKPEIYSIYFEDSPNHRATTQNRGTLTVQGAERVRVEFGAVAQPALVEAGSAAAAEVEDNNEAGQLDTISRVLIAALGAVFVMLFMLGVGVVIGSFIY